MMVQQRDASMESIQTSTCEQSNSLANLQNFNWVIEFWPAIKRHTN